MAKIQYQRSDKRPAYGDTKTENGKRYKRVFQRIRDWSGRCIGINYTGGRYHYIWEEINAAMASKKVSDEAVAMLAKANGG